MKINKKALQLIDKGLSSKTVSKLTESQINVLHKKLFSEQTMVSKSDTETINKLKTEKKPFQVYEKELDEDDTLNVVNDPDATEDGMGIFEKDYKDGPNPWAICHAQVGPKKTRKFERCVMSVKKQLKEGKNPLSLFLETQIEKIVEKHIPPRITKGDLLKVITESEPASEPSSPKRKTDSTKKPVSPNLKRYETKEQATAPAPAKPATRPTTKPTEKPKEKPFNPGKNPFPKEREAPMAKKRETKEQGTAPAPTRPTTKPDTKPTTKPSTNPTKKPFNPGKNPFPKEREAPMANRISPEDAKERVIDVIMKILEK
jgi:hypothetical protein